MGLIQQRKIHAMEYPKALLSKAKQWFPRNKLFLKASKIFFTREVSVQRTNESVEFLGVYLYQKLHKDNETMQQYILTT